MTLSVALQEGLSMWLLVAAGLVVEHPAAQMASAPVKAAGSLALLVCLMAVAILTMSIGSQKCPAAMSSTVFTSVQLSVAYVSQALIAKKTPDTLSIIGAM